MGNEAKTETKAKKRSFFETPSVTLMPGLAGVRVIEAKNGAEQLIDQFFPWYRVHIQMNNGSAIVHLLDAQCKPIKVNHRTVRVKFEGKAKLLGRLQDRAVRKWATESDEPITFEPVEESVKLWWVGFVLAIGAGLFISIGSLQIFLPGFQHPQPPALIVILAAVLVFTQLIAIGIPLFVWLTRPRQRSFVSVDLLPTGIVGTTQAAEVITLVFGELKKCKLGRTKHTRCRMLTQDGQTYWVAVRRPIRTYIAHAISPAVLSRKEAVEETCRAMRRQGFRFLVLGAALAGLSYVLINYLASSGAILPAHVWPMQKGMIGMSLLYTWSFGLIFLWVAWKNSITGRRSLKRFKARFTRHKPPKPANTTP